jgi:hypothetical protein
MNDMNQKNNHEKGKMRTFFGLWLLGVPIPLLFLFFLFRGCNF